MKKSLTVFITIALFFVSEKSNSQKYNWSKSFSSFADSLAPSAQGVATGGGFIETCSNGDLIVAGTFRGTMDADPSNETMYITSNGEYNDIFILRLTNNGEFIWVKQIGGEYWDGLAALKLDSQENIILSGEFQGSIDLNPGPEINLVNTNSLNNSFILKLTDLGEFIWEKHFLGNIPNWVVFSTLEINLNGEIMLTGSYRGTVNLNPIGSPFILSAQGFRDGFVLKINSMGQFIYAFRVGSEGDDGSPLIKLLSTGSFLLTGGTNGNIDIDPGPDEVIYTNKAFIGFYDSEAHLEWSQSLYTNSQPAFEGAGCGISAIILSSSGEFFLAGSNNGVTLFDVSGSPETLSSGGITSAGSSFFIKMDTLGNKIWLKAFQNDINSTNTNTDLVLDSNGNLFLTGQYSGINDFNPEEEELILPYEVFHCTYIVCLDEQTGIFKWARNTHGTPQSTVIVGAITANSSNNTITLTGFIYDSVDLNPGSGISEHASSPGSLGDMFLLNMGLCEDPINVNLNDSICQGGSYLFYDVQIETAGVYSKTFRSFDGCDSTVTLNLTITPQPEQHQINCWQTANFNTTTCSWEVVGTQPTQPETACYQTATFNNQTCAWELTGSPNPLAITTASACSTYVWNVNGQSYTTSNTYTYFANCQDYQLNLTINPIPNVTFEPDNTTYCNNSGSVDLSGGSPAGGVYSGPGVSNGAFNPAAAGGGLHPLTYSYTNVNGCSSSATVTYEVSVCTGVEAAAQPELEVRPNPIDNFIFLELLPNQPNENYKLELLDAAGRLVHSCEVGLGNDAVRVQLPEIAPGMYVLSLRGKERSFVRRVVR